MHFFNYWGFLALLGIPVILVMYLLKQKYKETIVPSLFLWQKAIVQSQSHKPWQKLKKNKLLFLQLLAVLALALALGNPYHIGGKKTENYILALDQSMSMQSKDREPSRFERAKEEIKKVVEQAPPGAGISILVMGNTPYLAVNNTMDKKSALNQLEKITVTNGGIDFDETVSLIELQREQTKGSIYVFTDKDYDFGQLPVQKIYIGTDSENCAITVLSHTEDTNGITALVKVKNFGKQESTKTITLYCDEAVFDVQEAVTLLPAEEKEFYFSQIPAQTHTVMARISPEDNLTADDTAYDVLEKQQKQKVLLVTEQNIFIEKIMALLPDIDFYKTAADNVEGLKGYSLYIFDGVLPDVLPEDGAIFVVNPPEDNAFLETEKTIEITENLVLGNHAVLRLIPNLEFAVSKAVNMKLPPWAEPIVSAKDKPLILAGEKEGRKIAVFTFDIHNSDLPLKKEFPVLMHQIFSWYFPGSAVQMDKITAGETIEFNILPESKKVSVTDSKGKSVQLAPPFPAGSYQWTDETGIYYLIQENEEGRETKTAFAVNGAVEQESDLTLPVSDTKTDTLEVHELPYNKSLRGVLILLLLLLIAGEWWVNCHDA